jgi:hypothetical protein
MTVPKYVNITHTYVLRVLPVLQTHTQHPGVIQV